MKDKLETLIMIIVGLLIIYPLAYWLCSLKSRITLKRFCRTHKTSKRKFEKKVYRELPDGLKYPLKFCWVVGDNNGVAHARIHLIMLSYSYIYDFYEKGYETVLEHKALCWTYGHEVNHILHPITGKLMWLFSKKHSIRRALFEVQADVEGRRLFDITQSEAFEIMQNEKSSKRKENRHITGRCKHPDWDDRCIYVRDYAQYDKELEERVKRDYCKKLRCSYNRIADLTIIE